MRYALTATVPATSYPVTLEEAIEHLRVDDDPVDANLIQTQIIAATALAENYTRRQFLRATYTLTIDSFPAIIKMPKPPLVAVTGIAYTDSQGVAQTLAPATYIVDALSEPGRVALGFGQVWPIVYDQINPITITFTCGWASAGQVPEPIKAAIKLYVGDMYQNRETTAETPIESLPMCENLLRNYVVDWWDAGATGDLFSWRNLWLNA